MTYQTIPYAGRLSLTLTPQTGSQIIEVYKCPRCSPALAKIDKDKYPVISVNGFLKNFDAKTFVSSLPEQSPPIPSMIDSEYESLLKAIEYENSAAKIRLNIYTKRRGGAWDKVAMASVLNPMGFEFRTLTLLDYLTPNLSAEFGEGDSLGISLEDDGHGLLKSEDRITISGSYTEEIAILSPSTITNNITNPESTPTEPMVEMPIGSIIAWHKNLAATALPPGWAECNGGAINDPESPYNGLQMPNLNGEKRFLRGSDVSGGIQEDAFQAFSIRFGNGGTASGQAFSGGISTQFYNFPWQSNSGHAASSYWNLTSSSAGPPRIADETRPKNMSVVWIMRIK